MSKSSSVKRKLTIRKDDPFLELFVQSGKPRSSNASGSLSRNINIRTGENALEDLIENELSEESDDYSPTQE